MPYVAPIGGLLAELWGLAPMRVLQEIGVDIRAKPFGPICLAPLADGNLTERSSTSEEGSSMLKEFVTFARRVTTTAKLTQLEGNDAVVVCTLGRV